MSLNLGNHWKGQFFTPYDICTLMSEITVGSEAVAEAKTRDYISVNDKTIIRLIQKHDNKDAVKPPFLGGFFIFGASAA